MRAFGPALALTIIVVGCAQEAAAPTTTPTTSPPTSSGSIPATTDPSAKVMVTLDGSEAVAVDRGIRLEVEDGTGTVLGWLDRRHPRLEVAASIEELRIRYVTADGLPTNTGWSQQLETPATTVRQPWRDGGECRAWLPDGTSASVILVWQSGGTTDTYVDQLDRAGGAVTVVSPVWWRMSPDGEIVSSADAGYVDVAHERNVAVWPAVAGFDAETHHLVFSDPDRRSALAAEISEQAQDLGADGVNIDIEGYRVEDSAGFLLWVEEMAMLVREWGGVVSHDLIPRSDNWDVGPAELSFWSTAPLRRQLSEATDCTILMTYDQHNRYRPAGPVASPPWVEEMLVYALRHTDPAELVLGMPFYGLVWDPADLEQPVATGIDDLERLVPRGEVSFDPSYGLDRVELADGRFFWAETPDGLQHRFDLVAEYGLAGWAAWRFGFDSPGIWDLVGSP